MQPDDKSNVGLSRRIQIRILLSHKSVKSSTPNDPVDYVMPKFSQGWLSAFKKRYMVKKFTLHGEPGSVGDGEEIEMLMGEIQTILGHY